MGMAVAPLAWCLDAGPALQPSRPLPLQNKDQADLWRLGGGSPDGGLGGGQRDTRVSIIRPLHLL